MPRYRDIEERLLANSVPTHTGHTIDGVPSECWLWVGNTDDDGYGRVTMRVDGKHRKVRAHRLAHQVFRGVTLAEEDTLDHLCRCAACIHPNHTEPVSRGLNSQRMQQHWRNYRADEAGQTAMEIA